MSIRGQQNLGTGTYASSNEGGCRKGSSFIIAFYTIDEVLDGHSFLLVFEDNSRHWGVGRKR